MVHNVTWKQIKASPDSEYGSPLARSSHTVEYTNNGTLYVLGGEHIARMPLDLRFLCSPFHQIIQVTSYCALKHQ